MTVLLPFSVSAQEYTGAILHGPGSGVFVNESAAPETIAVFPKDVIKTDKSVSARLRTTGSEAEISSETIVQFTPNELALDHGSVIVATSRGVRVRVGCIILTPVHDDRRTRYQVLDVNGKVSVAALEENVFIESHPKSLQAMNEHERERNRSLIPEGKQSSREEKCDGVDPKSGVSAHGPLLNSPYAVGAAGIGIAVIACMGLCHDDDPLSPAKP